MQGISQGHSSKVFIGVALLIVATGMVLAYLPQPAFAVIVPCNGVVSANTTLTGNTVGCTNNGILIGAPNITLNCAGHSVTGVPTSPTIFAGIYNPGYSGVTIENCRVSGFGTGILLWGTTGNNLIANNVHNNNGFGFDLTQCTAWMVSVSECIAVSNADYNYLHANVATYQPVGFLLNISSDFNAIVGNTANHNSGYPGGFWLLGVTNNLFSRNTADYNGHDGFLLNPGLCSFGVCSAYNTFVENTASHNLADGYELGNYSNHNIFEADYAYYNGQFGFELESSSNNTFSLSIASYNTNSGFELGGLTPPSGMNVFAGSTADRNGGSGFDLGAKSVGNQLFSDVAVKNTKSGFSIASTASSNVMGGDTATNNVVWGCFDSTTGPASPPNFGTADSYLGDVSNTPSSPAGICP